MQKSFRTNIFSLTSPLLLLLLLLLLFLLHPSLSKSQLTSTETISLFKIQKLLEHPPSLRSWNKWTNFCYLPPSSSLRIVCSNGHITELTVTGNRTVQLSGRFPSDSFFTVLTKLSSLKSLSLVSLGIYGSLSPKISRLSSLQVLNFSSNFISGEIPRQIASLENLRSLSLANNLFNGSVPDLRGLLTLEELNLGNNRLGPDVPSLASNLVTVSLKNNSFESKIPEQIKALNKLQILDISSSKLTGPIPEFLFLLPSLQILSLSQNRLSGSLPSSSCSSKLKLLDVSKNLLTGKLPSCLSSKNVWNHSVIYSFNCLSGIGGPGSKYQRPISLCRNQASAVKSLSDEHKKKEEEEDTTVPLGLVIGIIVAVVTIAAALALLVLIIMRRSNATIPETVSVCSTAKPVVDSSKEPKTLDSIQFSTNPI